MFGLRPVFSATAILGSALVAFAAMGGGDDPERISALEKRVASLEQWRKSVSSPVSGSPLTEKRDSGVFTVTISGKHFQEMDIMSGRMEGVFWDCTYTATKLKKPARSFKGVLVFCDLFDEIKARINCTVDKLIKPGGTVTAKGVGVRYNQFRDMDRWLRSTPVRNMRVRFEVTHILYTDGTTERFEK